ncbi:MAG: hypothetical protein IT437_03275 [Phycisphaerales bacterium]|nr:hypothetical protein [Phycisphaerales bacterium]
MDDYAEWYSFALRHDSDLVREVRRRRREYHGLLWGIALALVIMAWLTWREWSQTGRISVPGGFCVLALAYGLCHYGRWLFVDTHARNVENARRFAEGGGGGAGRTQRVEITEAGLVRATEAATLSCSWSHGVESVVLRPRHVFVYCEFGAICIPRSAFASSSAAEGFAAEVRRRVIDAGGPESARVVREFVTERDLPCPECGYNLRGLVIPRCPECGLQITAAELPRQQPREMRSFRLSR